MSEMEFESTNNFGGERPRRTTVRTTGILQNNLNTTLTAHIDLVNLNDEPVEVRVQVLNWGTAVTQTNPLGTLLDVTQTLAANTRTALNAAVTATNHYEVRLIVGRNGNRENVLLTTYGRTSIGGGQVNGLSVLPSQLLTVEIDGCL
ncbi:hypothetical protein [Brevibacillus gelatini]|uniref:Uncharacterized protein n=2 Tax=Brevibacillus gelatini TaxID=1655277 RepID=A0A3M8B6S1_9BACL|nr:hypothetical protein EDM57_05655 [Brevibacillus gelatini]